MTKEEARKRLEIWLICMDCPEDKLCYDSHLHSLCEYTDYCDDVSISEAIKVAIESLEQESCDDAINRKDIGLSDIEIVMCDGDYKQALEMLLDKIQKAPSVNPQKPKTCHWIPVSERLPEEAYGCLVTVFDTDVKTQEDFENILPYFVGYDGETWNNADGEPIPFEVIAWMPLPKPYKEG